MTAPPTPQQQTPTRRGRRGRRLLLALVSVLVTLGLLEVAGRIYAHATDRERGIGFDPVLGWHMLPHVCKRGEFWSGDEPGRTNAHGWRDAERSIVKPDGVRRIVLLGDTFTFGQGVDPPERFGERLAAATDCEVINLAACAFGTDQEVLVYETEGAAYEPDVVVLTTYLGNDLEDIRRDRQSGWSKPYFRLRSGELELVPPERSWRTALRTRSYVAEMAFQALERNVPSSRDAPEWREGDTLPLFAALIRRLQTRVARDGAELLVVLAHPCSPDALQLQRAARTDEAVAAIEATGAAVLDTYPAFAAQPDDRQLYLPNLHWSPAGHALTAELVHEALERHDWLSR